MVLACTPLAGGGFPQKVIGISLLLIESCCKPWHHGRASSISCRWGTSRGHTGTSVAPGTGHEAERAGDDPTKGSERVCRGCFSITAGCLLGFSYFPRLGRSHAPRTAHLASSPQPPGSGCRQQPLHPPGLFGKAPCEVCPTAGSQDPRSLLPEPGTGVSRAGQGASPEPRHRHSFILRVFALKPPL